MSIIAIDNLDPNVAGVITFWRLSGTTHWGRLNDALNLLAPGINPPTEPSPDKALRRAVVEVQEPRLLMRSLNQGHAKGYALVRENVVFDLQHKEKLEHRTDTTAHLRLDSEGRLIDVQPPGSEYEGRIRAGFERHLHEVAHGDVSAWLSRTVGKLGAVALRDSGGVYFIPRTAVQEWQSVKAAMKHAGLAHDVFTIPALRSEDAVAAITEALESETAQALTELEKVLEEDSPTAARLAGRAERCTKLLHKVEQYEKLLEAKQDSMRSRITDLQADLIAAKLLAEAAEAEAE